MPTETDYALQQQQVDLLEQLVSLSGGTPTSSRLVSINPTGGSSGTGDATKTFPSECLELSVSNDSETPLTFTVGAFSYTLEALEVWEDAVPTFTQVTIDADAAGSWRVWGRGLVSEAL
jgi:hypothetical protein